MTIYDRNVIFDDQKKKIKCFFFENFTQTVATGI